MSIDLRTASIERLRGDDGGDDKCDGADASVERLHAEPMRGRGDDGAVRRKSDASASRAVARGACLEIEGRVEGDARGRLWTEGSRWERGGGEHINELYVHITTSTTSKEEKL